MFDKGKAFLISRLKKQEENTKYAGKKGNRYNNSRIHIFNFI
ncbi:hypothetical protein ZPR_1221 [Zunongwangia profunda SM-A87]|uniref:Uncharacterized protein n=1 Tax=Zunongwangia profunda (strain DSM 18752 / CCTCC AB 206139 / SM-A87) TaxID=655815 RepID=D5BIV8_ZUNPS|nr:hypothetical protein ZPR_1221 [Zunongwangia profunda SM-A87]